MFNQCRHIKNNGQRCGSPALKGKPYCFFHMKFDRMHKRDYPEIPPIEDSTSVLLAIGQVVRALNYETMDLKRAGLMLYGLQIAATVTARNEQANPADTVRSIHNLEGEPVEFNQAFLSGAPMLAPEASVCEPPHDCANCAEHASCEKRQPALKSGNPEDPDEFEHNPEEAARRVREGLYAHMLQLQKEEPGLFKNPPPTPDEIHRYFAVPEYHDGEDESYSAPLPTPLEIHPLKASSRPLAAM